MPRASGNSIAAANKEEWLGGVLNAPQTKGINTIAIYVTDCNKIIWFWNFEGVGSAQYPVRGFNLFTTSRKNGQIQTDRLDIEFDSISWGLDSGLKVSNFIPPTSPHKQQWIWVRKPGSYIAADQVYVDLCCGDDTACEAGESGDFLSAFPDSSIHRASHNALIMPCHALLLCLLHSIGEVVGVEADLSWKSKLEVRGCIVTGQAPP
ncbi:uncharacterized protein MYCFIDRAFT_84290 [Pseudocercospora fijiensis CIRAD86]|uniref:NTF2-like domain-containing protein n=1 Tax=Pseudocercospora fijiensis (strain CIRAD86) TaxID=383855 RepID=M2ZEW6_PSEFD|nr:uncharacterized protein MYCFIDRAFT_84290 [Pseudocercospora fijiensis CIRAD86]EME77669.1 hypothetical protein MYCFIDRAFT_84290 [Pseudocercospora fijiensis CIRAD86]